MDPAVNLLVRNQMCPKSDSHTSTDFYNSLCEKTCPENSGEKMTFLSFLFKESVSAA